MKLQIFQKQTYNSFFKFTAIENLMEWHQAVRIPENASPGTKVVTLKRSETRLKVNWKKTQTNKFNKINFRKLNII